MPIPFAVVVGMLNQTGSDREIDRGVNTARELRGEHQHDHTHEIHR